MDVSNVEEMNVEEAWKKLEMADKEKDMDDFKEVCLFHVSLGRVKETN